MRILRWLNPLPLLADIRMFVSEWMMTRSGGAILRGLPFVTAMMLLLGLIAVSRFEWHDATAAMEQRLQQALQADEGEQATRLVRQLLRERPYDVTLLYHAARLDWGTDNHDQALAQLSHLALARQHGPAAAYLIEHDAEAREQKLAVIDSLPQRIELVRVAASHYPRTLEYQAMLADLLIADKRVDEAIAPLRKVAEHHPGRGFQLALLLKQQGKEVEANTQARRAAGLLGKQNVNAESPVSQRMLLAALHQFLKNWPEVLQLLAPQGSETPEEIQQLRSANARVLIAHAYDSQQGLDAAQARRLGFVRLSQAVQLAPQDPVVINAVAKWLTDHLDAESEQTALLEEAVVQGMSPGFSHFILGTTLMLQGKEEEAALHLELAEEALPTSPAILNNLAFTLASQTEPDLERALVIVNTALTQSPDHPSIRDTRGQVLLGMGRYKEAIVDLEFALRDPKLHAAAHQALATAYEAIGKPTIAARHQKLAQEKAPK